MRFVQISKPVSTKHDRLGSIEVPVETPQCESIAEAVTFHGGEDALLEFINAAQDTGAKNVARAFLRDYDGNDVDAAKKQAKELARGYVPGQKTGGAGAIAKARNDAAVQALRAGKELSREELLALLEGK